MYLSTQKSKNLLKNYKLINLLRIFDKICEINIKYLFNHFRKNQLFTKCQFGFFTGDSRILQLLIVNKINSSFDCDPTIDVGGIFLDIPKVSGNV